MDVPVGLIVESREVVAEYEEAVTEYIKACELTLEQKKVVDHANRKMAAMKLPLHGNNLERWDSEAAEEFSCQLDLLASAHKEQAERIHSQVRALRRMNRAIALVTKEAKPDENR